MRIAKIKTAGAAGQPPHFQNGECGFGTKAAATALDKPLILIFQQTRAMQSRHEIFFHFGKAFSGDGIPGDQNDFDRRRKFILMPPETFTEQAPRTAAGDRAADAFARDDAQHRFRAVGQ